LKKLKILDLMDITLRSSVPDQTEDRRVRTLESTVAYKPYGLGDRLSRDEHLSIVDMVIPRFRDSDEGTLFGMFNGQSSTNGGSKLTKFLYDEFKNLFKSELDRLKPTETPGDAFRRTYLRLNSKVWVSRRQCARTPPHPTFRPDIEQTGLNSGCVATVLYIKFMDPFVSNVGDAQALLIESDGGHRVTTQKHDPAEQTELDRMLN
jgi:adenylate cyclase